MTPYRIVLRPVCTPQKFCASVLLLSRASIIRLKDRGVTRVAFLSVLTVVDPDPH
jgi:hypothetical protein